jgi:hypothetical protein
MGISTLLAVIYNEWGLNPTHSDGNAYACGADVVSAALAKRGIRLSPGRIKNIAKTWLPDAFSHVAWWKSFSFVRSGR